VTCLQESSLQTTFPPGSKSGGDFVQVGLHKRGKQGLGSPGSEIRPGEDDGFSRRKHYGSAISNGPRSDTFGTGKLHDGQIHACAKPQAWHPATVTYRRVSARPQQSRGSATVTYRRLSARRQQSKGSATVTYRWLSASAGWGDPRTTAVRAQHGRRGRDRRHLSAVIGECGVGRRRETHARHMAKFSPPRREGRKERSPASCSTHIVVSGENR
jgi:hypothetical protein